MWQSASMVRQSASMVRRNTVDARSGRLWLGLP